MFRLDEQFRWALDLAALDREDELNAVVAAPPRASLHRVHRLVERVVRRRAGAARASSRRVNAWPVAVMTLVAPPAGGVRDADERAASGSTTCGRWRPPTSRPATTGDPTSRATSTDSVLPLMLRDARARRPDALLRARAAPADRRNRPPPQSPALRRYVDDAAAPTSTARGALFHDDTGDPALTLDMYEDGDHLARDARRRYTENLYNRLRPHFPVIFHSLDFVVFFVAVRRRSTGCCRTAARTCCCLPAATSSTATSTRGS